MKVFLRTLSILGPILIGLSQVFPATAEVWSKLGTEREVLLSLLSFYFAVLGATLINEMSNQNNVMNDDLKKFAEAAKHQFSGKLIPDHEFYLDFLNSMRNAKNNVNISYFAPYPPDTTQHKDRKEYYKKIKTIIKGNPRIHFRRLVRYTEKNKPWIKQMLKEYKDIPNFHLAIVRDLEDFNQKMSYSLSVQVIDDKKCWLVAIESHEGGQNIYRDLYLESEDVGKAMRGYYARLWSLSDKLIETGVLTDEGRKAQNSW